MKRRKDSPPGHGKLLDAWTPPKDAGEPVGCVATTFTFNPAFFEEECLGRFLQLETDAAEDGPAYLIEREEKIVQLACASVLVDCRHARGLRSLRWDLLPARPASGILHAKVSVLLWSRRLRLIVASANLTEDGYRRNLETFAVLDYFEGAEAPLPVLDEMLAFLRDAATNLAGAGPQTTSQTLPRWNAFLDRAGKATREWGMADPPRGWKRPRILALVSGSGGASVLDALRDLWPGGGPPDRAFVVSPFFDPPGAPNAPAHELWRLLKQRGETWVEYHVTGEEVPGSDTLLLHAPESLLHSTPQRPQAKSFAARVMPDENNRPLHAKCLWLENPHFFCHVIGSSNFTSAGLGIGATRNWEANLAFLALHEDSSQFHFAWPPYAKIPPEVTVQWKPLKDEDSEADEPGAPPLPAAFADATFADKKGEYELVFSFHGEPPAGWRLFPEEERECFIHAHNWDAANRPVEFHVPWSRERAPSGFRVEWTGASGSAWWPVNVASASALPPPEDLRDLPLEVLVEILSSARPLHQVLARWMRKKGHREGDPAPELDPHKRVDTSSFLLQRTRRISWALAALGERLQRPVVSETGLEWRLRGPIGVDTLARAIDSEARSDTERRFLLGELALELARVRPLDAPGCLPKTRVRAALREAIEEIRARIAAAPQRKESKLQRYLDAVFEEISR